MKKFAVALLTGILISTAVVGYSKDLSEELADGIVRLHIVAQSNSEKDQRVKLKIRDAVLKEIGKSESKDDIVKKLPLIEEIANNILKDEVFDYKARAEMGKFHFPTKYYDNFALPEGEYEAVRIKLGKAEGENWWCVLFPPLCMVDSATMESEELLKETFGENYAVVKGGEMKVNIKFKLAELF